MDHVDILDIAGIDHSTFYNSGQDVKLVKRDEEKPFARVFRKGGKVVYRAGEGVLWDEPSHNWDH